jgi:RES domain-containing protein
MFAYRLALARFGDQLYASGISGRWNKKGETVIYASSSRSLCILENLVHRGKFGMGADFFLFKLHVPESLIQHTVQPENLPSNWSKSDSYSGCQEIGSAWYRAAHKPYMIVPSAIIPEESNLVINANHHQFQLIRIEHVSAYSIDDRLKVLI